MTIRKSIKVERPPDTSFKVFCEEIGQWWPKGPSFGSKPLADMVIERRVGGRFFERYEDGTEYEIGRITAYQPPSLVAFTWRAPSWKVATQVEVRFSAEGEGTRVELDHSGWEQEPAAREAHKSYDGGWDFMLGHYTRQVAAVAR